MLLMVLLAVILVLAFAFQERIFPYLGKAWKFIRALWPGGGDNKDAESKTGAG